MSLAKQYASEIREFLVAILPLKKDIGRIDPKLVDTLPTRRILDWWIFEAKGYRGLERPLCREWQRVHRMILALRRTHNPRWSAVQAPEGEVDWIATAFATMTAATPTYVCRSSKIGLSDDEAAALEGWQSWVAHRWDKYTQDFALDAPGNGIPWTARLSPEECADPRRLRRWAHAARRSRWPLLRSVVAESLRCLLEPIELDQLPLPTEHAVLFELVCLVRVLKAIGNPDSSVRWLDLEANRNTIQMPGIVCRHQHHFGRDAILATEEFDEPLRRAIVAQEVPVPVRSDLLIELDPPIAGFEAALIECKSGSQGPETALHQLKCYSAAWPRSGAGRRLLWAITEERWVERDAGSAARALAADASAGDTWVFSTAEEIRAVLEAVASPGGRGPL
jgi:hypothetical protein